MSRPTLRWTSASPPLSRRYRTGRGRGGELPREMPSDQTPATEFDGRLPPKVGHGRRFPAAHFAAQKRPVKQGREVTSFMARKSAPMRSKLRVRP